MQEIVSQLASECRNLADLCDGLTSEQWVKPTDFHGWTPWDEIAHLAYFDETAFQAANTPEIFLIGRELLRESRSRGDEISNIARSRFLNMNSSELMKFWRNHFESLCSVLSEMDPKARVPWYGPEMSARSFATARLMETWAHGQDIRDLIGKNHWLSPGLRQITHLGVNTYRWSFINRGQVAPEPIPFVELEAPDGSIWKWGDASETNYLRGSANDFALLVTQRRHRSDTLLDWKGESADRWTHIAQCFAGAPSDGPKPQERKFHA
jgi:uncharacterized protein (TIGR03084 family)